MKMVCFIFIILMFVVTFTWDCQAQTNLQTTPSPFKTVLTTNWVKPGPYLRVVNGQLYNVAYSTLWGDISKHEGLGISWLDPSDSGEMCHLCGAVYQIKGTTVFYGILKEYDAVETWTGQPYKTRDEPVKTVVIFNYSDTASLVTGQGAKFWCMKTTNYITSNGISYTAYDCGTQYTNLVPVVKKEIIKPPKSSNSQ